MAAGDSRDLDLGQSGGPAHTTQASMIATPSTEPLHVPGPCYLSTHCWCKQKGATDSGVFSSATLEEPDRARRLVPLSRAPANRDRDMGKKRSGGHCLSLLTGVELRYTVLTGCTSTLWWDHRAQHLLKKHSRSTLLLGKVLKPNSGLFPQTWGIPNRPLLCPGCDRLGWAHGLQTSTAFISLRVSLSPKGNWKAGLGESI